MLACPFMRAQIPQWLSGLLLLAACSDGSSTNIDSDAAGGGRVATAGSGGQDGSSGAVAGAAESGGVEPNASGATEGKSTAGASTRGGSDGSGSAVATGGTTDGGRGGTGGYPATAGSPSGGAPASGGSLETGGDASGGREATGGYPATAGSPSSGAPASGGSLETGGGDASGGREAMGGGPALGGSAGAAGEGSAGAGGEIACGTQGLMCGGGQICFQYTYYPNNIDPNNVLPPTTTWRCEDNPCGELPLACDCARQLCSGPDCVATNMKLSCAYHAVCAAPDTLIATPSGERPIADLRPGDLVYSVDGASLKPVPILMVTKTPVSNHRVVELETADGSRMDISPGHPTADGRRFADLRSGDRLDGALIVSARIVPYRFAFTYDILPASDTATYVAFGKLIGSTLR